MTITWMGHACFLLESGGYRVLLDPFKGVRGYPDTAARADAVYCSHGHFDHAYTDEVTLTAGGASPFTIREVDTFHDDQGGAARGSNTVRCLTAGGLTAVHLGDLGHQLTDEQAAAIGPCDALLIPVGGTYTLDAAGARAVVDRLKPRVVIPMHYRVGDKGLEVLDTVEGFLRLFPAEKVRRYPGQTFTLDRDTPDQVAVLAAP